MLAKIELLKANKITYIGQRSYDNQSLYKIVYSDGTLSTFQFPKTLVEKYRKDLL